VRAKATGACTAQERASITRNRYERGAAVRSARAQSPFIKLHGSSPLLSGTAKARRAP